jgi:DNA-binding FrmR family transcriptional regulator
MKTQQHATTHTENLRRLARIEGQVRGIRRMIEEGAYCMDILMQLEAAEAALRAVSRRVLRKHLETCLRQAAHDPNPVAIETKLDEVIRLLEKQTRR